MPLGFEIGFDRPWFLLLLVIIPVMWAFSFNSLAGLGRGRCILALAFRSLVVTLVVFAIADAKWQRSTDRLTVLYLLDQSESISDAKRKLCSTLLMSRSSNIVEILRRIRPALSFSVVTQKLNRLLTTAKFHRLEKLNPTLDSRPAQRIWPPP